MYRNEYGTAQLMSFNTFLTVKTVVMPNESSSVELPVTVNFTVINSASPELTNAEILFEEVLLRYGIPPDWHLDKFNNLAPGQSFSVDYRCSYQDLHKIQFEVEGKVSWDAFSRAKENARSIRPTTQTLSTLTFLQLFNDFKIHNWQQGLFKNILIPNESQSLVELKSQLENMDRIGKEITRIQQYFDDFSKNIQMQSEKVQRFHAFKDSLQKYFGETTKGLKQLRNTLETPNSIDFQKFSSIRDTIATGLLRFGSTLNKATEEFMTAANISDADAHYSYRDWLK